MHSTTLKIFVLAVVVGLWIYAAKDLLFPPAESYASKRWENTVDMTAPTRPTRPTLASFSYDGPTLTPKRMARTWTYPGSDRPKGPRTASFSYDAPLVEFTATKSRWAPSPVDTTIVPVGEWDTNRFPTNFMTNVGPQFPDPMMDADVPDMRRRYAPQIPDVTFSTGMPDPYVGGENPFDGVFGASGTLMRSEIPERV